MILVNGAAGIGTGWSTNIPNYNPLEIVDNLLRLLDGEQPQMMHPWYMGYTGTIEPLAADGSSYGVSGRYIVDEDEGTIEIFDLPLKKWTDDYKEFLKNAMTPPNPQTQPLIMDYVDGTTDAIVHFKILVTPDQMTKLKSEGIPQALKLTSKISTRNMVLFDENGVIRTYTTAMDILQGFFSVRLQFYHKRKADILSVRITPCVE